MSKINARPPHDLQIKSKPSWDKSEQSECPPPLSTSLPKEQKATPSGTLPLRTRQIPPVRTKENLLNKDNGNISPEGCSTKHVRQIPYTANYITAQKLVSTLQGSKATVYTSLPNRTPPHSVNAYTDSIASISVCETPSPNRREQTDVRTASNTIQAKTYEKRQSTTKEPAWERMRHHQHQARADNRKEYIKSAVARTKNKNTKTPKKIAFAISRTAKAIFNAIAGISSAGAILILLCAVILAGAIAASPLGVLFTDEASEITLTEAIAEINADYQAELRSHQAGKYSRINNVGRTPSWRDVVAVFACKTAWSADGTDVITLDAKRIDRLSKVFWDMTDISSSIETIKHEDTNLEDEVDDSHTETILTVTTTAKTADDMRAEYNFSKQQNEALDLLLEELEEWGLFLAELDITDAGALALWDRLPENLSNERRLVVQYALSLVGKVNYFWGGKSLVLGWDSRWGSPTTVTAAGSPTTGTIRPYGMDCSGFVDWVFYNVSGGSYVIGRGGGCIAQHNNCQNISWSDVQPGDLVFYPGDSHIGIVGGWDEYGNIQIIHCASGSLNGVVITGNSQFIGVASPYFYLGNRIISSPSKFRFIHH